MDILKRQRANALAVQQQRVAQQQSIKQNPKPPIKPIGPSTDISQGIAFGTRRTVKLGGRRRKRTYKKRKY
jgi:hypothetical protein